MKTSDHGLKFIMQEEGTVLHPYKDIAGILTIGCGHVVRPGESFGVITLDQAMELLRHDVGIAENAINTHVTYSGLTQNMYDAMCSFAFNNGGGALASSTLVKLLNAGDVQGAADQFPRWAKTTINGVLTTAPSLLARRNRERAMFLTPDAPVVPAPQDPTSPPDPPAVPTPVFEEPTPPPMAKPEPQAATASQAPAWKTIFTFISTLVGALFGGKK